MTRQRSFTLMELLLATVLFSFLAVVVYSIFSTGIKLNTRSSGVFSLCREISLGMDLLSREIENAAGYDFTGSFPERVALQGSSDKLEFLAAEEKGLNVVEYRLGSPDFGSRTRTVVGRITSRLSRVVASSRQTDVRQFLIRRQTPFHLFLASTEKSGEDEIIISGVIAGSLKFRYSAELNALNKSSTVGLSMAWQDKWSDPSLPAVIRVEMSFLDPVNPGGPVMVVTRDIVLPVAAEKLRKAETLSAAGMMTTHTLDVRYLDSVKDFKQ